MRLARSAGRLRPSVRGAVVNNAALSGAGPIEDFPLYAELWDQWTGTDAKVTGPVGRPGPELVGVAIADAIENPDTPLRVPVGSDAETILGARRHFDDASFEAAMRKTLDFTW